jgi:TatD DNase family protein
VTAPSSLPAQASVPLPDPLPAPVIDSHCHLDIAREPDTPALPIGEALALARSVNVVQVVQVGCDLPAARRAVDWARDYPAVHAAVSLHPTEATETGRRGGAALDDALEQITALAADPAVVGVGETGLDHYWTTDREGRAWQERSFREHIRLARSLDKTLVIHDRDAHDDVVAVLEDEGPPERVVFHCFSGGTAMARHCARNGWYLSFAGPLTFRNADGLRDAARAAAEQSGLDLLLVETDAPYLTPHPHRGQVNSSYLVPWTVRALAQVVGVDVATVCDSTREATRRAFRL